MKKKFHKGQWDNVQDECVLCRMKKQTEVYLETPSLVVAEKMSGGSFVVWKEHKKQLYEDEMTSVENVVDLLFDEWEINVTTNICESHWSAHILTQEEDIDLSDS